MAIINSASTTKRRRFLYNIKHSLTSKSNWSELPSELLELILSRLSFLQIIRFQAVCSFWHHAAKSYISSSLYTPFSQPPLLMLPSQEFDLSDLDLDCDSRCFYDLEEKKDYTIKYPSKLFNYNNECIGSSHGWLILVNVGEFKTFLFNPLSKARVELPSLFSHVDVEDYLQRGFRKAILLSDPSHDKDYGVVVIFFPVLLYCKKGDSCWNHLNCEEEEEYAEIISYNNQLYALTLANFIDVWDFQGSVPIKKREINPSIPRTRLVEAEKTCRGTYSTHSYLVDSCSDLLLVERLVGDFVNEAGEVVDASYILSEEFTHRLIWPYKTKMFHVYKLDSREQNWVELESLNNQVLFLGLNHSMSFSAQDFSGCEGNSVYFTDDNWDQMFGEHMYHGHDFGIFNLEEKVVKPLINSDSKEGIFPPPLWIVPNPW